MLSTAALIYAPSFVSGSDYNVQIYFKDASKAKFLNYGDNLKDSADNQYQIKSGTLPNQDGAFMVVTALTNNVLPAADIDYNSSVYSPGQESYDPVFNTLGAIHYASLYNPVDYEYYLHATWDGSYAENIAVVGDRLIDTRGKEFSITYIDPIQRFNVYFRAVEVHRTGDEPSVGQATLYRTTPNYGFYQGTGVHEEPHSKILGRDSAVIDKILKDLKDGVGSGPGGDDAHYIHDQQLATTTWSINHNMGKHPSVTVVDSGGTEVVGDVIHTDNNTLTLIFSAPFTGKAYLN